MLARRTCMCAFLSCPVCAARWYWLELLFGRDSIPEDVEEGSRRHVSLHTCSMSTRRASASSFTAALSFSRFHSRRMGLEERIAADAGAEVPAGPWRKVGHHTSTSFNVHAFTSHSR